MNATFCSAVEEIQNILTILEETESLQVADNIADDAENVEVCLEYALCQHIPVIEICYIDKENNFL